MVKGILTRLLLWIGIFIIFAWRLIAKYILHIALPPVIRLASHLFELPNRRFYTPATEYETVPPEEDAGLLGMKRPIPSMIDLPSGMGVRDGLGHGGKAMSLPTVDMSGLRMRNGKSREGGWSETVVTVPSEQSVSKVKHYDADGKHHILRLFITMICSQTTFSIFPFHVTLIPLMEIYGMES